MLGVKALPYLTSKSNIHTYIYVSHIFYMYCILFIYFIYIIYIFFFSTDKVSSSPAWSWTSYVTENDLELLLWSSGSQVCTAMSSHISCLFLNSLLLWLKLVFKSWHYLSLLGGEAAAMGHHAQRFFVFGTNVPPTFFGCHLTTALWISKLPWHHRRGTEIHMVIRKTAEGTMYLLRATA